MHPRKVHGPERDPERMDNAELTLVTGARGDRFGNTGIKLIHMGPCDRQGFE